MRLILCADDFGLSQPISETIAGLAMDGKINAVSCMAATRSWERDAKLLAMLPAKVQLGLHLVLTDCPPVTAMPRLAPRGALPSLAELERRARQRRLPSLEIASEAKAQIDRFVAGAGRSPDFVDGHQHVHVLPGIRDAVLDAVGRDAPSAWIRDCTDRADAILARPFRLKAIGSAFHSRNIARDAARRRLRCNRGFAGHYGFTGDYERLFPRFLRRPGPNHLIMCHPGAGQSPQDPIAEARVEEARALRRLSVRELAAAAGLRF
jgi:predicted glycoside hydrolase/deacetylase ChbG (UPF0249 family)